MRNFDVYKTVYWRSAKALEARKQRCLWCFLVVFLPLKFCQNGAGLLTVTPIQFWAQSLWCLCQLFSSLADDVWALQLHVTWWDCAYLNVFATSFCCACTAAEWANEHRVKCRPSCVLTGTGGVPQRSHFRTHEFFVQSFGVVLFMVYL